MGRADQSEPAYNRGRRLSPHQGGPDRGSELSVASDSSNYNHLTNQIEHLIFLILTWVEGICCAIKMQKIFFFQFYYPYRNKTAK